MDTLINMFQQKTEKPNKDLSILHFHNGYELIFITNGETEIEISCKTNTVKAPAIILLNPFEQHKIAVKSKNYERTIMVLNADILEQSISPRLIAMLKCRPQGFSHIIQTNENDFATICTFLNNIANELNGSGVFGNQYIQNCVYNILILIYRAKQISPEFSSSIMKIQTYIDENYAHIESVNSIAEKFCISLPHLSRTFKNYSGYSPVEYLKNTRLYHAQQFLIDSDYRINEISSMVGFRNTNNFIKQFTNKFGISPQTFRGTINR